MKIETKYDIDQMVQFKKFVQMGKNVIEEVHIGIIEKFIYNGKGISYLMKSSYQNWVPEDDIDYVLVRENG